MSCTENDSKQNGQVIFCPICPINGITKASTYLHWDGGSSPSHTVHHLPGTVCRRFWGRRICPATQIRAYSQSGSAPAGENRLRLPHGAGAGDPVCSPAADWAACPLYAPKW